MGSTRRDYVLQSFWPDHVVGGFMLGMLVGSVLAGPARSAPSLAANGGTRMLSLDPYAAYLSENAFFNTTAHGAIVMPNAVVSRFTFGFTVPLDYSAGTPLTVRMVWATGATDCRVDFSTSGLTSNRVGQQTTFVSTSIDQGRPVSAPASEWMSNETLLETGVQPNVSPGDSVNMTIYRPADSSADTCEQSVHIQGLSLIYQTNAAYMPRVQR
jgi:hypothetical protein